MSEKSLGGLLTMRFTLNVKKIWHKFNIGYYVTLFEDCLCDKMKYKFKRKISYHKFKLDEISYSADKYLER